MGKFLTNTELLLIFCMLIYISLFGINSFCGIDDSFIYDVCGGDIKALSSALDNGIPVDYKDPELDASLLHYAVLSNNPKVVSFLIKRGANVNIANSNGDTPLHRAASFGYNVIVNILLAADANVNCKNLQGLTPLIYAVIQEHPSVIDSLINQEIININDCDLDGLTALHHASLSGNCQIISKLCGAHWLADH